MTAVSGLRGGTVIIRPHHAIVQHDLKISFSHMSAKANFKIHPLPDSEPANIFGCVASSSAPVAQIGSDSPLVYREHHIRAFERARIGLPENDKFISGRFGKPDIKPPLDVFIVRRARTPPFRPQLCPPFPASLIGDCKQAAALGEAFPATASNFIPGEKAAAGKGIAEHGAGTGKGADAQQASQ